MLEALQSLRDQQAVWFVGGAGSRVIKYEHRLGESLGLSVQESAILAELLLRGPQTPGEVRTRSTRMYPFPDLKEVEAVLEVMQDGEAPLVERLPRQPGTKETRYAHRLGDGPAVMEAVPVAPSSRVGQLEAEVAGLKVDLARLREEFEAFRGQF